MAEREQSTASIRKFLRSVSLFQHVSPSGVEFAEFAASVQVLHFKKGQLIYCQGEVPEGLYLVREGEVQIVRTHFAEPGVADFEGLIGVQSRGGLFGEVSFLSGEVHSSNAEAAVDCTVFRFPPKSFFKLLTHEPAVGEALSRLLSQRLRNRMQLNPSEVSSRSVSIVYPENPANGSIISSALGDSLIEEKTDSVVTLSFHEKSIFVHKNIQDLKQIIRQWPDGAESIILESRKQKQFVFAAKLTVQEERKLTDILPGLIALLKKYFSVVLIDPGSDISNPLVTAALVQSDRLIMFESLWSGRSRIFAEVTGYCFQNVDGFYEKSILVNHEPVSRSTSDEIERGRFGRIIRLRSLTEKIEETDATVKSGLGRIARGINGSSRAICLGGGGARSFAHIGVLEVFADHGIEFDAVVGTSMGAVIGAAYSLGLKSEEIEYTVRRILPTSASILDRNLPLVSFFKGNRLNASILKFFRGLKFEDLEIPFYCNASDLNSGRVIVFDRGYLASAIRASVSLPGVFPPFKHGPHLLVDGGVLNNLPGGLLRQKGYNVVLGVNVSPVEDVKPVELRIKTRQGFKGLLDYFSIPPILKIITRSLSIESRELLKMRMDQFDYMLSPEVGAFDTFDFDHKDRIIDAGRIAARAHIAEIKEVLGKQKV